MSTKINYDASVLEALESQPLDWKTALGELIDNSLDAGAARVQITHAGDGVLVVSDDGRGCDDLLRMMTIGKTYGSKGGRLGRYGVGFKEAAIWMAHRVDIRSAAAGMLHDWQVDWDHVKANDWDTGTDPKTGAADATVCAKRGLLGQRGMSLCFHRLRHRFPGGKNLQPVLEDIGYIFSPAISRGTSIIVTNGKTFSVKPYVWPPLENVVDRKLVVNGKECRLYAGIVPAGTANKYPGFSLTLHHRVIQAATGMGARGYSIGRVTGRVELSDAWRIAKNKTSLVDSDASALEEAIFEAIEPMLRVAQMQTDQLVSAALKTELTNLLNRGHAKAKRNGKAGKKGTVVPVGTGRKHKRAACTQPGQSPIPPRTAGGLTIEFTEDVEKGIGWVDFAGNRIWLCVAHQFVKHAVGQQDKAALACLASSLYVDHLQREDPKQQQRILPGMADVSDKFTRGITELLAGVPLEKKHRRSASNA